MPTPQVLLCAYFVVQYMILIAEYTNRKKTPSRYISYWTTYITNNEPNFNHSLQMDMAAAWTQRCKSLRNVMRRTVIFLCLINQQFYLQSVICI